MTASVYVPARLGRACLDELGRVPWASLGHAYAGCAGDGSLETDVAASLRALGAADRARRGEGFDALWSNIWHQGTVYEATAHAVPFLAAVAVDPSHTPWMRVMLAFLLGQIAVSASYTAPRASHAGAIDDETGAAIRAALIASGPMLDALAALDPPLVGVVRAIGDVARRPSPAFAAALEQELERLEPLIATNDPPF